MYKYESEYILNLLTGETNMISYTAEVLTKMWSDSASQINGTKTDIIVKDNANFSISEILRSFYFDEIKGKLGTQYSIPFISYIMSRVSRKSTEDIATAAMTNTGDLLYNPHFLGSLPLEEARFVVLHELYHYVLMHCGRYADLKETRKDVPHHIFNEAADLVVNQLIDKRNPKTEGFSYPYSSYLVKNKYMFYNINDDKYKAFPRDATLEVYVDLLMKDYNEEKSQMEKMISDLLSDLIENGDGEGEGESKDGTDASKNSRGKTAEEIMREEEMKDIIKKAIEAQQTHDTLNNRQAGNAFSTTLTGIKLKDDVVDMTNPNVWKNIINKHFAATKLPDRKLTVKRRNRRLENSETQFYYGKTFKKGSNCIAIILDTSGSVMNDISDMFKTIEVAIKKFQTTVDIYYCTSDVYRVERNITKLSENLCKIASGGTDLTQAQKAIMRDYVGEDRKNLKVVCITDAETPWLTADKGWNIPTAAIYVPYGAKPTGGVWTKTNYQGRQLPEVKEYSLYNASKTKRK